MPSIFWLFVNTLQGILLVSWTLLCLVVALTVRLLSGSTRLPLAMAHHIWSPFVVRLAGCRLEVSGLPHLVADRRYFFAVNHQSMLDVPALYRALPMPLLFVLKEELGRIPIFGAFVRLMGMVLIKRQVRRQAVQQLVGSGLRLPSGHCLVAFPEGTRSDGDHILPFKPGVFVPAIDAQIPVVPIAMEGPARLLPKGTFRVRPGRLRMVIGEPITTDGLQRSDRRELARQAEDAVRRQWQILRAGTPDGAADPDSSTS